MRHHAVPPRVDTRLRRGEPLAVLFDANVLLDVFLQRPNAYPAARALTFAEADVVDGYICASAFGVICHHGAARGPGRHRHERRLAEELMRFLGVLPLTKDILTAALRNEFLSYEDAQVAASGNLKGIDAILTSDRDFIRGYESACSPQNLVGVLEEHFGAHHTCRVVRVTAGQFRVEISDSAGVWRQTLPLAGFPTQEQAELVAGLRQNAE